MLSRANGDQLGLLDLRHVRAFVAVAESRSFTKAARKLRITQPPLSRQIKRLEKELEVNLFIRTGQGVELTREGMLLLPQAQTVLAEAAGFLTIAGSTRAGVVSAVKVGLAWGLWDVINRVREHLATRHPSIEIDGVDLPSSAQHDALRQKSICAGLLRPVIEDPAIQCEPLFEERFVVTLSDRHRLAKHKLLSLKQVAGEPLLLHERAQAPVLYNKILALYEAADVTPNIVTIRNLRSQAAMLAVASGKGIALALQSSISRSYYPLLTGVNVIPLDEPDASLDVQLARRAGETSPTILRFCQSIREAFPTRDADRQGHPSSRHKRHTAD
jgi:DNA-binding transcriptional LysR family regulator